jgi:hypothetical protein
VPNGSSRDEVLAAAADAIGGRTTVQTVLQGVRERAQERARDELRTQVGSLVSGTASRAVRLGRNVVPRALPQLDPSPPVEIRLPNGRRVPATVSPAPARRSDVIALARVNDANDRQAFAAIRDQSEALGNLQRSHDELAEKVASMQRQSDQVLLGLLEGLGRIQQRVRSAAVQGTLTDVRSTPAVTARQQQQLQSMATASRIQQVTAAVNSAQTAAFGQRGSVLAPNNLLLMGNQLLWSFIDPLLRGFGVPSETSRLFGWLAPLGTLLTGQLVLGNRQHLRFISGVAVFEGNVVVIESLRDRIADSLWPEFSRRTDVPVTTVALEPMTGSIRPATVREGVLRIEITPSTVNRGRVAWMVDTGEDIG